MSIDREKILRQLARVHNQATGDHGSLTRHRKAVAELVRDGHDASLARKMLKYAEHVQTMTLAERQRLEEILGERIEEFENTEV
jgi:hypothetical protein